MPFGQPLPLDKLSISQLIDKFREQPRPGSVPETSFGRTLKRGSMVSEYDGSAIAFQFNPTRIEILKKNRWEHRQKLGNAHAPPIWISSDMKTVRFQLIIDATAGSNYALTGGIIKLGSSNGFGNIESSKQTHLTLDDGKGTIPHVELIESFQYPVKSSGPYFINGNASLAKERFVPPPTVRFSYGYMVLKSKVIEVTTTHELFNERLIPTRSTLDIVLSVMEGETVDTSILPTDVANNELNQNNANQNF